MLSDVYDCTSEITKQCVKQKILAFCSMNNTDSAAQTLRRANTAEGFIFITINAGCGVVIHAHSAFNDLYIGS